MRRTEMAGYPINLRIWWYTRTMAKGWHAWIESIMPNMLGNSFTHSIQIDVMLDALAIGAGRWAANPSARPPRSLAQKERIAIWEAQIKDGRDFLTDEMTSIISKSVQTACQELGTQLRMENDIRAIFIPLQVSAMRSGAGSAFADFYPIDVTLDVLDASRRENSSVDIAWWELESVL